mmetsp:Transcript_17924/g.39560  ORF Transcript_17924/g.39560 Transcript_17924/m.39560 type:complete len:258 (-) Transcript_17924:1134-1907(-)
MSQECRILCFLGHIGVVHLDCNAAVQRIRLVPSGAVLPSEIESLDLPPSWGVCVTTNSGRPLNCGLVRGHLDADDCIRINSAGRGETGRAVHCHAQRADWARLRRLRYNRVKGTGLPPQPVANSPSDPTTIRGLAPRPVSLGCRRKVNIDRDRPRNFHCRNKWADIRHVTDTIALRTALAQRCKIARQNLFPDLLEFLVVMWVQMSHNIPKIMMENDNKIAKADANDGGGKSCALILEHGAASIVHALADLLTHPGL